MGHRKPLERNCNGSIDCPVYGHTEVKRIGTRGKRFSHITLTRGQRQTLWERHDERRVQQELIVAQLRSSGIEIETTSGLNLAHRILRDLAEHEEACKR